MRGVAAPVLARATALAFAASLGCSSPAATTATGATCAALVAASDAGSSEATGTGLWVGSDYSSSEVGAFALDGALTAAKGVNLGADPVLAVSRGRAFFIARDEDLIFELDPACGTPRSPVSVHQASHTGSSNPQDLAVASDGSLWVPLYDVPSLLVLDASGAVTRTIDLSSYDGDGNPNASAIAIVDTPSGEKAFVALQRLDDNDGLKSEQPSWMLRVDVASRAVEAHVQLVGRNPFAMLSDGAGLWLSEPGNFDDATETSAGIERFDTTTSTSALVAREPDLGGSVAEVAINGACGVAIVADATTANATSLVTFDTASGAVLVPASGSPLATSGLDLEGLAWGAAAAGTGGALLVGDRRRLSAGYPVHAFDSDDACSLHERAPAPSSSGLFLPLPPIAIE